MCITLCFSCKGCAFFSLTVGHEFIQKTILLYCHILFYFLIRPYGFFFFALDSCSKTEKMDQSIEIVMIREHSVGTTVSEDHK